ncbi:hypothetical protein EJ110_NYTH18004 [Nymphaea thermarum]|nr:hypothetical protein EJ110_NYTH18004 [Nymphaea thermarum]
MAQFQRKKTNGSQKSYPGCMGIMVNLFDLNFGVSGNKLLTEKPHCDGSDLPRSQAQMPKKAAYPDEEYAEERPVTYEARTCPDNTSNGTPMKMLLAQEMSKEIDPKGRPPGVVARLMGLDAIPAHEPFSSTRQSNKCESYSRSTTLKNHERRYYLPIHLGTTHPGTVIGHQHGEIELKENYLLHKRQHHTSAHEQEECKDVYEVWQSCKMEKVDTQSLQKVRHNNHLDEKKMDLVRQKFLEAKRLATDEKLRQSKEFQDALEVLSSNRELFLKFLQEPNSLFSQHLTNLQSIPPPSQTKRITVLKPSKAVMERGSPKQPHSGGRWITSELRSERLSRIQDLVNHSPKRHNLVDAKERKEPDENRPPWSAASNYQTAFHVGATGIPDGSHHPTRIVVLKPSPKKAQDIRMVVSSPPLSPRPSSRTLYASSPEKFLNASADENQDLQVRQITRQIHESISSKSMRAFSSRDETFLSSTLSNGYVGDESSHGRSENEYAEAGNLSDSEIMTPTSRYSWDFINRCSPYSSSSISRVSYSSESSVTKEAKKRLSERWALMANGNQERHLRRSSSTLGEMLAIPEAKKTTDSVGEIIEEVCSSSNNRPHAENDNHEPGCVSGSKSVGDGTGEGSPRNLLRSRSVPVSSKAFDSVRLEDEAAKPEPPSKPFRIIDKPKSAKSLKGKVSSLFFSKNKKASKEKCDPSAKEETSRATSESHELCKASASTSGGCSVEAILSRSEPRDVLSDNQEQPSPVSVLELPFEDEAPSPPAMDRGTSSQEGNASHSLKVGASRMSSLESIATTLSWEDPNLDDQRTGSASTNAAAVGTAAVNEQEQFSFVQKVISSSGLDRDRPDDGDVFDLWHSSKCPLDPSLLEKVNDQDTSFSSCVANDPMSSAKLRRAVLERRLLFDCTNAILLDMAGLSLDVNPWSIVRSRTRKSVVLGGSRLAEEVWRRLRNRFAEVVAATATVAEGRECVDEMLKKEVEGREWDWLDMELVEVDAIGKEIENDVLNDLIEDTVSDTILICCS